MTQLNQDRNEHRLIKIQSWLCWMPVFGVVPAVWSLYHPQTNPAVRKTSRLALQLTISWFVLWLVLMMASQGENEFTVFRAQYLNGLLTSGYFATCVFAIVWQGRRK